MPLIHFYWLVQPKLRKNPLNMAAANTTFRPRESLIPNPKLRLREQVHEVMRFKQFSLRTESAYWNWMRQFIFFHNKRHPREMGKAEVEGFLTHLAKARNVAVLRRVYSACAMASVFVTL